jgi:deazaflavin-dependent oxidoreductase (nitroreductase family)
VRFGIHDDRYVVVTSKAGADTHPDWYHNLVAHPAVSVEVGTEHFRAVATVALEPERTRLFEAVEAISAGFTAYKNKTTRIIPVVTLNRKSS